MQTSKRERTLDRGCCKTSQTPPAHLLPHTLAPASQTQNDSSLCKKGPARVPGEQWAGICSTRPCAHLAAAPPHPPPGPHILILFGMRCQATFSVNTAPGNSDRKPPLSSFGKSDAIRACEPIRPDNWVSVLSLAISSLLFPLCDVVRRAVACIHFANNQLPNLCWFMNFPLITISSLSPISRPSNLHCRWWPRKCHYWASTLLTPSHQFPVIVGG